jgi:hypothetical protein
MNLLLLDVRNPGTTHFRWSICSSPPAPSGPLFRASAPVSSLSISFDVRALRDNSELHADPSENQSDHSEVDIRVVVAFSDSAIITP